MTFRNHKKNKYIYIYKNFILKQARFEVLKIKI